METRRGPPAPDVPLVPGLLTPDYRTQMSELTIPTSATRRTERAPRADEELYAAIVDNDEDWQRRAFEQLHGLVAVQLFE